MVLLVSAAVFAVAMHGSVVLRAATIETGAVSDQMEARRVARSAAILAVQGLITRPDAGAEPDPRSPLDADPGTPSGDGAEEDEPIELPPIMRALLGEDADLIEDELTSRNESRELSRRTGDSIRRVGNDLLERVGLPAAPLSFFVDGRAIRLTITDATSGINVNNTDEATLRRLFTAHGLSDTEAEALANQILDWIDQDDFVRPRSLETREHARLGVSPRNGEIPSIDELRYLPAMTPQRFERLERDLTVAGAAGPHLPSASPEVLIAHGFSQRDAGIILRLRQANALNPEQPPLELSPSGRELVSNARLEPSSVLRLTIDVFPPAPPALADTATGTLPDGLEGFDVASLGTPRRFRGIAVVGDRSVEHLALRAEAPAVVQPEEPNPRVTTEQPN